MSVSAVKPRDGGENGAEQMRNEMTETEQLERDAEIIRAHLAKTLTKLRALFTPGHVVNQLLDLGSDSTALKFVRNLRDKTVANPLALGVVSVGIVWLMFSNRREAGRQYGTLDRERRWIISDNAAQDDVMAAEDREELKITAQDQEYRCAGDGRTASQ